MIDSRQTLVFVDDSPRVIAVVCSLVLPTYNVVKLATDEVEAVSWILELKPDLAILDICTRIDGIAAARKLSQAGTKTRLVLVTQIEDEDYVREARRIAHGYVLKRRLLSDLLPALVAATAGSFFLSH